jgi:hypothetical protein
MIYLIPLVIPLLNFILQSYPRLFNKFFGVDVWTRLLEIDQIKKAGHKIPNKITKGFIIQGYFDYPPVFPFIFSFFSKKFLLTYQGFVSPFFDALQNIFVFVICYQLTNNVAISLVAQAIYSLTPIIPIENSYLTPRSLGYFMFTLAFYPILLFHVNHQPSTLFLSFLFTTILFLTHRFALQSFIFISLFFTFFDQSWIYLFNLISGFVSAVILTKGYYLRVAKGHWSNIYFWILQSKYRFAHQIYGLQTTKKLDWVGKVYSLLSTFSPIFLFGLNVWILSGFIYFYLVVFQHINIINNPMFFKMSVWILFFYLFGAIVLKVRKLLPIGEGQRYLEMATVPGAILSSVLFFYFYEQFGIISFAVLAIMLTGNLGLIVLIQIKGIIKDKNRSLTDDIKKAYAYINKLSGTPRIICIPHQNTTMTIYHTKADVLVNADNEQLMTMFDFYPVLKKPLSEIKNKYHLDYLLMRETFVKLQDLKLKKPNVVFKSGDILLIKL